MLLRHFGAPGSGAAAAEGDASGGGGGGPVIQRVIVFTNLRDSVHSIAAVLKQHSPLIEPRRAADRAPSALNPEPCSYSPHSPTAVVDALSTAGALRI